VIGSKIGREFYFLLSDCLNIHSVIEWFWQQIHFTYTFKVHIAKSSFSLCKSVGGNIYKYAFKTENHTMFPYKERDTKLLIDSRK